MTSFYSICCFDTTAYFQGVSVEDICSSLRGLHVLQEVATTDTLVILCEIQNQHTDSIEVTLVDISNVSQNFLVLYGKVYAFTLTTKINPVKGWKLFIGSISIIFFVQWDRGDFRPDVYICPVSVYICPVNVYICTIIFSAVFHPFSRRLVGSVMLRRCWLILWYTRQQTGWPSW